MTEYHGKLLELIRNPTQPARLVRIRVIGAVWDDTYPRVCIEIGENTSIKDIEAIWHEVESMRDMLLSQYGPELDLSRDTKNLIVDGLLERNNRGESYTQLAQWVSGCIEDCLRVSLMILNGDIDGLILGPPGMTNWGNGWFGFTAAMELTRWFGARMSEEDRYEYLKRAQTNIDAGRPAWGANGKESPIDALTIRERLRQINSTVV